MSAANRSNIPQEPKVERNPAPLVFPPGTPSWIVNALRRFEAAGPQMNRHYRESQLIEARLAERRRLQELEEERLYRRGESLRMNPEYLEGIRRRVEAKSMGKPGEPTGGYKRKLKTRRARKARKTRKQVYHKK